MDDSLVKLMEDALPETLYNGNDGIHLVHTYMIDLNYNGRDLHRNWRENTLGCTRAL
jgi:hypothetical protein